MSMPRFKNRATQKIYNRMREQGVDKKVALGTIKMTSGEKPIPEPKQDRYRQFQLGNGHSRPDLPYYFGNKRIF